MNHTIWEVLSVWWIVVLVDLAVCYCFVKIAKEKNSYNSKSKNKINHKNLP
jgi:hypothetical protein